jgi:hypothetical protein
MKPKEAKIAKKGRGKPRNGGKLTKSEPKTSAAAGPEIADAQYNSSSNYSMKSNYKMSIQ